MLTAAQLPDPSLPWPIPMDAVRLIAESEGLRLNAYKCPAGVWTCGYGETAGVGPKTIWTKDFSDQRFLDSLGERTEAVRAMVTVETSDNQLGALVSLAYNIGLGHDPSVHGPFVGGGLRSSSVLKAHNRGDFAASARAFAMWNKARVNGKLAVLPGLVTRRAREAALYLTPEDGATQEPMPQAVAPEPTLTSSPTATVSTASAAAGAVGILTNLGDGAKAISEPLDSLKATAVDLIGIPPAYWPWVIMVLVGGLLLYRRLRQRWQGVA